MTKNQKIALVAAGSLTTALVVYYNILTSEIAIFELFPDIDSKILVKAHRKMVRRSLMGAYNHIDGDLSEDQWRETFIGIVREIDPWATVPSHTN